MKSKNPQKIKNKKRGKKRKKKLRKRKERVYWVKDDESHPIPNSQLHQPPITPYSHFPFLRFSLSNTFHIHSHFSRKTQIPTQLTKKKKKTLNTHFLFSLSFSLQTRPNPLFLCLFPRITQIP